MGIWQSISPELLYLLPLFFAAAFLYSSVGHGGGSAYLAIMAFTTLAPDTIRTTALVLNVVVASVGFFNYQRARHFSWRLLLPFVVASIPAAYVGGLAPLSPKTFSLILAVVLGATALRLIFLGKPIEARAQLSNRLLWIAGPSIGGALGLLSGMVGVGGGIFLSPILLFLGWADAKKTAAASAAFILFNSLSGLAARVKVAPPEWQVLAPLALAVLIAGMAGSRLGASRIAPLWLQRLLAAVLVVAAYHLFKKALGN